MLLQAPLSGISVIDPAREPVGYRQSATRLALVKPDRAPLFFADQPREDLLRQLRGG